MNVFTQARKEIKALVLRNKALMALDELLEKAGEFEKLGNQAQGRLEALIAQEVGLGAKLQEAETYRDELIAKANQGAADIIRKAQEEAAKVAAEAQAQVAAAHNAAEELKAQFEATKESYVQELRTLSETQAQKVLELTGVQSELKLTDDKLAQAKAELAKIKEAL